MFENDDCNFFDFTPAELCPECGSEIFEADRNLVFSDDMLLPGECIGDGCHVCPECGRIKSDAND